MLDASLPDSLADIYEIEVAVRDESSSLSVSDDASDSLELDPDSDSDSDSDVSFSEDLFMKVVVSVCGGSFCIIVYVPTAAKMTAAARIVRIGFLFFDMFAH